MKDLRGKSAFITGGASGLGLGMARAFAESGMNLVLTDIDEATLAREARTLADQGVQVLPLRLDVTDRAAWEVAANQAEQRFGPLHVLCNNAGIMAMGWDIDQIPVDIWDLVIRVDLTGAFNGCHTMLPRIKAHKQGGHIVNTASMSGLRANPGHAVYAAAKAGLIAMSDSMRMELVSHDIGVSVLCPGHVRTNLLASSKRRRANLESAPAPGRQSDVANSPSALDPLDVGRAVRHAILENLFYIVTHEENRAILQTRFQRILDAFDVAQKLGLDPRR